MDKTENEILAEALLSDIPPADFGKGNEKVFSVVNPFSVTQDFEKGFSENNYCNVMERYAYAYMKSAYRLVLIAKQNVKIDCREESVAALNMYLRGVEFYLKAILSHEIPYEELNATDDLTKLLAYLEPILKEPFIKGVNDFTDVLKSLATGLCTDVAHLISVFDDPVMLQSSESVHLKINIGNLQKLIETTDTVFYNLLSNINQKYA